MSQMNHQNFSTILQSQFNYHTLPVTPFKKTLQCERKESALKLFKFLFSSSNFFTFHIFYNCLHVSVECFIHEFLSFYLEFSCFILFDVEERYFYFIFTNIQRLRVILNFSLSYRITWPRSFQYFKPIFIE